MVTMTRVLATSWAGGIAVLAVWTAGPLMGFASAPAVHVPTVAAALPLAHREPGEFALILAPAVGWQPQGEADFALALEPPAPFVPPPWYPPSTDILVLGDMDGSGPTTGPTVKSRAAFVYDIDGGRVLYEKNPDTPRPVASITKLVSSLALVSADPDLTQEFTIGPEQYPPRSGARSRLSTGDRTSGWDVLGAALVASDNRAAMGLAAAAGMHLDEFVGRMNRVSVELGMTRSSWADPSGLEDGNVSTARDIAKATVAVAFHPVLQPVASAPFWDLWRTNKVNARRLGSTDRLIGREDLIVETAKTGYTDAALYTFTTVLRTDSGRHLAITLLGADGKLTRWADMNRILTWLESGAAGG